MHHVLLIRPIEDALPMALELKAKGIESSHYPLFKPQFFPIPCLENPQALIITSKNGIRALIRPPLIRTFGPPSPTRGEGFHTAASPLLLWERSRVREANERVRGYLEDRSYVDLKSLPIYTVGDKTAEFAKQSGFINVFSASGTSKELTELIKKSAHPRKGILWHLSGQDIKGNIVESLQVSGFEAQRKIIYEMEDVTEFPTSLCRQLTNKKFSHVIFCSPRTTQVFVNLVKNQKLEKVSCQMHALCLSEEIGKKASSLNWKKIWISSSPTMNDLMRYFDEEK